MIIITLNFHQRMALWMRLGTFQVSNLLEASKYIRILEKIRPQDEELKKVNYTVLDGGRGIQYSLPDPSYGTWDIDLEDEEAKAIESGLMNHQQPFRVDEADWMLKLIAQIKEQIPVESVKA